MLHEMNAYIRGIDHILSNQVCASRFAVFYRCGLPSLAAPVLAHQQGKNKKKDRKLNGSVNSQ